MLNDQIACSITSAPSRKPAAHAPKVAWATSRSDALDMLTLASMLHRRLDKADVRQTVP
jgi:hypothetical protein